MKKTVVFLLLSFISLVKMEAQDAKFMVTVSTDSILMDNNFQVTFTLENAQGMDFEAPTFTDFEVLSGPNVGSSFSMMNGAVSQSISYTYLLGTKDIGNYFIQPASIKVDDKYLETEPLEVVVFPNPDGVVQRPKSQRRSNPSDIFGDMFDSHDFLRGKPNQSTPQRKQPQQKPAKKKRKTYKL